MCRMKNGNPARASRFICIRCEKQNHILDGIQRVKQREKYHIKDCLCLTCGMETKNVEVRFCDDYNDVYLHIPELVNKYYDNDGKLKEEKVGA